MTDARQEWYAPHNPWLTSFAVTLSTFMEVLDTSIANVSLPHIAGNLGAGVEESTWVLTSYLVSNAIVLPISGWFSSLMGRKNFYLMCVALFTASSFLCGLAPSLEMLVLFRLLQGLGGGGLQPSTQAILVDTFPLRQRGMGMALYGVTVVAAPIIGPTLGGWITDNFSWRWIFFINIPVGFLSLLLTSRLVSDPPYFPRRRGARRFSIDYIGLGLLALGLGSLQMVLDLGERKNWFHSDFIIFWSCVSAVCIVLTVIWEWTHKDPIVDLRLLRDRNFGLSTLLMLIFGFVLLGSTVLLPLFMQTLLSYTALLSGLATSPGGLVVMVLMPLVGWMLSRFDARWMIAFGIAVISVSLFQMGRTFSTQVDFTTIMLTRILQGCGMAFIFVPVNTVAYAYISRESRSEASSIIGLARNIGASIGIAFVSSMLTRGGQVHRVPLVAHLTPSDPAYVDATAGLTRTLMERTADPVAASLQAQAIISDAASQQARALAFISEFRILAAAVLVLVLVAFLMRPAVAGKSYGPAAH